MQITVKLFGAAREAAGAKELSMALPDDARVGDVWAQLVTDHPTLEPFENRLAVSVNLEISSLDARLRDADEVAFLPPVSGGSGTCTLSTGPLDVGRVVSRVAGPGMGGIVTFVGAVRNRARGRDIRPGNCGVASWATVIPRSSPTRIGCTRCTAISATRRSSWPWTRPPAPRGGNIATPRNS